jgi:hypothetical protein
MRQDLPRRVVIKATQIAEPGVRAFAVGLDRTPVEIIAAAALDEAWQVRAEAARHRACPPETLAKLAYDPDAVVRRSALAHQMIPASVLIDVLTGSPSRLDAQVAGGNSGFSVTPHVDELMNATSFGARALMNRGTLPDALAIRFTLPDHSDAVREAAIRCFASTAGELPRIVEHDVSASVRAAAAEQESCPSEALDVAAGDASAKVRRRVADNPHTSRQAIDVLLGDIDESVRVRAARHPAASPSSLGRVALTDEVRKVRVTAMRHDLCPSEVLDELCADSSFVLVVGVHGSCTAEGLFRALLTIRDMPRTSPSGAKGADPAAADVRQLLAVAAKAHRRLARQQWSWLSAKPLDDLHPDDLGPLLSRHLSEAAVDPRLAIRMAVAKHPNVDGATLAILSTDADEAVRVAVSTRILDAALGRPATWQG